MKSSPVQPPRAQFQRLGLPRDPKRHARPQTIRPHRQRPSQISPCPLWIRPCSQNPCALEAHHQAHHFSLVVDDFGVKYISKENANRLIQTLQNCIPSPSTGQVPSSEDSPLIGTMLHAPATYPCQNISKQPCTNSNIRRPNAHNTPHTP